MDFLSICALVAVILKDESCHKPYLLWYSLNGAWAALSFTFLWWWQRTELKGCYQTKKCVVFTYVLEGGYLALTIFAWVLLSSEDTDDDCALNAPSLTELLVDMIILLYMRSLRLLSISIFMVLCGPVLLYCWWKNKPKPTEDPGTITQNFSRVTLDQLVRLREMNYRHEMSTPRSNSSASGASSVGNPYDQDAAWNLNAQEDVNCCICMEDFTEP